MSSRDPFARSAEVPGFTVTSSTVQDGQPLAQPQFSGAFGVPGGQDRSPPVGDDAHRYFITVFALDTDDVAGLAEASPAVFEFSTRGNVLARATLVPTGRIAAE